MKPILKSKVAKELPVIEIAPFLIECPYCESERIYRFNTNLKAGVKCKCCKEYFAVEYFSEYDKEWMFDEPTTLIQCDACYYIWDTQDLRDKRSMISKQGNLVKRSVCDCGCDKFTKLTVIETK